MLNIYRKNFYKTRKVKNPQLIEFYRLSKAN